MSGTRTGRQYDGDPERMTSSLQLHGKAVPDKALYPWALGSLARAIVFASQARASRDNRAVCAITTYYSAFHLAMFLLHHFPGLASESIRRTLSQFLRDGEGDPVRGVRHQAASSFLHDLAKLSGLPGAVPSLLDRSRTTREFLNYGPRISWPDANGPIRFNTCELPLETVERDVAALSDAFTETIGWSSRQDTERREMLIVILENLKDFFAGQNAIYSGIYPDEVLRAAEAERARLRLVVQNE